MRVLIPWFFVGFFSGYFAQPFVLPNLPYAYQAYAPYIDAQTMEIHLTKHHQAYVNNLNKAIKGTRFEQMELVEILVQLRPEDGEVIRNNAGGHYNHSLFWDVLAPTSMQGNIKEELLSSIQGSFGNMDSLKKEINKAAMSRFGSGWAWLILTPQMKLAVVSTANQDNPLMPCSEKRGIPILGIDVWEHAYYLNYQNRRADYLTAVWSLIDWSNVSEKYTSALTQVKNLVPISAEKKAKKKG
ncbi:MAG: superoxide dismutase [Flavobacteriales bacterium]